jgi:hypothetical protein
MSLITLMTGAIIDIPPEPQTVSALYWTIIVVLGVGLTLVGKSFRDYLVEEAGQLRDIVSRNTEALIALKTTIDMIHSTTLNIAESNNEMRVQLKHLASVIDKMKGD